MYNYKELKTQFKNIKSIIHNNIIHLKTLTLQSEKLDNIINNIDDFSIKYTVAQNKNQLDLSINNIFHQTDKLFSVYKRLLDEIY